MSPTWRLLEALSPGCGRCAAVLALLMASVLAEVAIPYFTGHITDWVVTEEELGGAWPMVLLGATSAVAEFSCDVTLARTLSRSLGHLRCRVFSSVLHRAVPSLQGAGAVTARVTGDVEATQAAVAESLGGLMWLLARGLCVLVTMAWLSPPLALGTMLALPLVFLLPRRIGCLQQALARRVQDALADATKVALETFQAMATVRSFAHEAGAAARYREQLCRGHRLQSRAAMAYAGSVWATKFSALALKLGLLFYGERLVASETITPGDLFTFLIYHLQLTEIVESLLLYCPKLSRAVGSSEKVFEFLDEEEKVTPPGILAPDVLQGYLQLEDVWFSYPEQQEPVLKGLSLELRPGEVLAVVAPPGAGKSTLVALVLRLLSPVAGRILLDGQPLAAYQHHYLCQQVVPVLQEPLLFSRSLHANISYGLGQWTRAQVTSAARRAGAHSFITRLPRGYDTEVGELGGQLSGGQRQAVAIARALLRNPKILVLDEPTSALDAESRLQVEQEIFGAAAAGRAVLLVTGQVTLAARAPRVALLDRGRLWELEDPMELLCPGSHPWCLLQRQGQEGTAGDMGKGTPGARGHTPKDGDTKNVGGDTRRGDGNTKNGDGDTKNRDGDAESLDEDTEGWGHWGQGWGQ